MIPVGAAVCNAEERGEFQREHALRGLLHRPAEEDSTHGGLHLQDRARAGWQVWRLRLRDRRVERDSSPADGQGECVRYASVCNELELALRRARPRVEGNPTVCARTNSGNSQK